MGEGPKASHESPGSLETDGCREETVLEAAKHFVWTLIKPVLER